MFFLNKYLIIVIDEGVDHYESLGHDNQPGNQDDTNPTPETSHGNNSRPYILGNLPSNQLHLPLSNKHTCDADDPDNDDHNQDNLIDDNDCYHGNGHSNRPDDHGSNQVPVYIPEDIPIPAEFELRESKVMEGLGVWTKVHVPVSSKFGPFLGNLKPAVDDTSAAWEVR